MRCPRHREMRAFFSCLTWRAIPSPLSKLKRKLDSLEANLWAPRDPRRGSRGERTPLLPLEVRPSSFATSPAESRKAPPTAQDHLPIRGTMGSSLRSPAEVEGNEAFPPQPQKHLECPSSMPLEALVLSHDSRAMTRSPSPRARRPDFPGTAREAP